MKMYIPPDYNPEYTPDSRFIVKPSTSLDTQAACSVEAEKVYFIGQQRGEH